jgi:hypothetical protein
VVGERWSKFLAVGLALWVAGLVPVAPASALGERGTGGFAAFNLKASNGYAMHVIASSKPGFRQGKILIWLAGNHSSVLYVVPGTVTDTRIAANLGALGLVDLAFEPSGKEGEAAPACQPEDKFSYEDGAYAGQFDFHGEEGYAAVTATRTPLSLHPYIDFICGGLGIGETFGHGIRGARLTATARKESGRVSLQANQNHSGARVKMRASIDERHGRILVHRDIHHTSPASAFHFDPKLRAAILTPPTPFSGFASYRRNAKRTNGWTGNLTVDFPGHSRVSLTGAGFAAHLRHARLTETRFRRSRSSLSAWPSTKPSPLAFATPSPLALR